MKAKNKISFIMLMDKLENEYERMQREIDYRLSKDEKESVKYYVGKQAAIDELITWLDNL